MTKLPSTLFVLLIIFVSAAGQKAPTSFLEKRVTFAIPSNWQIQSQEDSKTMGRTQILIPYALTDNTPHSANAAIIANNVPDNVTVKDIGDRIAKQQYPGMAIINDIPDGKNWRTIVWTARTEGVPYLMLNRFGLVNHVAVEFVVGFPLFENGDTKWVERVVADFNATCETLKIDGTNSTEAKVYLGKLPSKN
ncbi:MAG TPA: hypothetical protein VFZ40_06530 [Pyrinomonadaceae bacterium]